jgi:hypothetical protein
MSQIVAYEIQTFSDGKWKIDAIFDDQELAVLQAKHLIAANRFPAVRVVQEAFDEAEQKTKSRVVFRSSTVQQHNADASQRQVEVRREVNQIRDERAVKDVQKEVVTQRVQAKKQQSRALLWIGVRAAVVLVFGAGAYIALKVLAQS